MKISQLAVLAGLIGLMGAGLLAPTIYATADSTSSPQADGQFPVFPTVIEDSSPVVSPTMPTEVQKTTVVKTKTATQDNSATNGSGNLSLFGYLKNRIFGGVQAGGEGVILALEAVDANPTSKGDLRYQIFYTNNTSETLRNVSIQVSLPKNFQYLDSDVRPSSKANGMVVYELGKVAAGENGTVGLEVRAKKKKVKDAFLSATMTYEDIDGNAQVVNATASNAFNGKNGGGLSASILGGAGGFMIWLFVIILLIAIAFVAYQYLVVQASARRAGG